MALKDNEAAGLQSEISRQRGGPPDFGRDSARVTPRPECWFCSGAGP